MRTWGGRAPGAADAQPLGALLAAHRPLGTTRGGNYNRRRTLRVIAPPEPVRQRPAGDLAAHLAAGSQVRSRGRARRNAADWSARFPSRGTCFNPERIPAPIKMPKVGAKRQAYIDKGKAGAERARALSAGEVAQTPLVGALVRSEYGLLVCLRNLALLPHAGCSCASPSLPNHPKCGRRAPADRSLASCNTRSAVYQSSACSEAGHARTTRRLLGRDGRARCGPHSEPGSLPR